MRPPVEIADHSEYRERMKALLEIDPKRTVLLTVDMQRDYLDLAVASSPLARDDAERVLSQAAALLDFARAASIPVIHVYVQHRPVELVEDPFAGQLGKVGSRHDLSQNVQAGPRRIPNRLEGSPQAEVPATLLRPRDVHVTTKKTIDAYLYTDLGALLERVYRPEVVVLTGINTDTCVYATAMSTAARGYKALVVSDCVASTRGKDQHWMALELMSRSLAWVLTVEEFQGKVRAAHPRERMSGSPDRVAAT